MKQSHTLAASASTLRVVVVTLDSHMAGAFDRARRILEKEIRGLSLRLHIAAEWGDDPEAVQRCNADIAKGDIIVTHMLFMEEHIDPVFEALEARRDHCDAMIGCMSAEPVVRLTRMGRFSMQGNELGFLSRLKRLGRGKKDKEGSTPGARQAAMLRRIPQILRFVPGTAQDVRAYFLTMQYWLAGSEQNVVNMIRFLVGRYASGPEKKTMARGKAPLPVEYPDVGLYHPQIRDRITDRIEALPRAKEVATPTRGRVGLLLMRSYVLAGNTAHYDGVIAALEAKGLQVVPAFASGLDSRPAIERFFMREGRPIVDAVVSLTGFSLVGGPAYNDAAAAKEMLTRLDVPYISALAVEFQSLEQWRSSDSGLAPIEATMMVAIPELDGAIAPMVFGGRCSKDERDMRVDPERAQMLADRVAALTALRATPRSERKIAVVLFNFPPNAGNTGTAMYLSVFESLYNTLSEMRDQGYQVEVPASVDELREQIVGDDNSRCGAHAKVHVRIPVDDHVRREPWLAEIEEQWGPAPGAQQSDGSSLFVLGHRFGNVFVGVQPAFGYEGDPMRLLFERGFAPTHAFAAFYRFIREDFGAHGLLHFGTHGALEFMPGKQVGLSGDCWPERLIGALPHFYLYAANNPSEASIAKRRAAATVVSYLTAPVTHAGLYRGLLDLKTSLERWRSLEPGTPQQRQRGELARLIREQAEDLDLLEGEPSWEGGPSGEHHTEGDADARIELLGRRLGEFEQSLIPHGLHVVGRPATLDERTEMLLSSADATGGESVERAAIEAIASGYSPREALAAGNLDDSPEQIARFEELATMNALLSEDHELPALMRALDGRFIPPTPGGDLLRTPEILPTGRNLHGFDPFRIPSAFAVREGARQAEQLLGSHQSAGHALPESIALVLWGSDNLKTEGAAISQALALIGATPRFDSYGRLAGADLIPLEELGRPRIDVVTTLSGIFRDLLPLQTRLLADASFQAASADESCDQNFVRKHALAYQESHGCDLETAALRVFSNATGAYGANVSQLVQNDLWNEEDELAEVYTQRKSFAYRRSGGPVQQSELLQSVLGGVDLAYQNLDSVELGVTTVDVYFDNLGGISRAIERAGGDSVPIYIGDQTGSQERFRTLSEQVELETRTRTLNPKWYEGMLEHGFEGVRQIETQVTNTMGWSATTGQVAPWVYGQLASTFVLDPEMRERLAGLNPTASALVAQRLIEAQERSYWAPDPETLEALREAGAELEDRLEGINAGVAA